jgi:PPM family protein phosphatase
MDLMFPPASSMVQVEFGAGTRRGQARTINEDHYAIIELGRHERVVATSLPESSLESRFDEYGYAMIVADGMGGSGSGEAASRLAVATLIGLAVQFGKWNLRVDNEIAREIIARAERFYRQVDARVAYEGSVGPVSGLQSTLTAAFGAGRDLFFAHVGHSRAYLFRSGTLTRLTRDHTIVPDQGPLRVAPTTLLRDLHHIVRETIGMGGLTGPNIDLERFQLDDQDIVLVCTNGVSDALGEDTMRDVLDSGGPSPELSEQLVDLAMTAGGRDDATALVGRFRIPASAE